MSFASLPSSAGVQNQSTLRASSLLRVSIVLIFSRLRSRKIGVYHLALAAYPRSNIRGLLVSKKETARNYSSRAVKEYWIETVILFCSNKQWRELIYKIFCL